METSRPNNINRSANALICFIIYIVFNLIFIKYWYYINGALFILALFAMYYYYKLTKANLDNNIEIELPTAELVVDDDFSKVTILAQEVS